MSELKPLILFFVQPLNISSKATSIVFCRLYSTNRKISFSMMDCSRRCFSFFLRRLPELSILIV